jgi:hypothetical protein
LAVVALGEAADDSGATAGDRVEQVRGLGGGDEVCWVHADAQGFVAAVFPDRAGAEFVGDDQCEAVGVLGAANPA